MATLSDNIIAALIALFGALLGYAFREYRNRVNPLFEIIKIWTTSKRSEKVAIDSQIVQRLRGSFYPQEIQPESSIGVLYDTWDRCDDLEKFWPEEKKYLEAVIDADAEDVFISRLANLFNHRYFDHWLTILLINNRLDFLITDEIESSPERIHAWFEDEGEYKVWFDLPPAARSFGRRFNHPAVRGKCKPFITAVSRLHIRGIVNAFSQFIQIFDVDYNKALSSVQDLNRIDNENERWAINCFLANTSSSPVVVETLGYLTVVDSKTKTEFREDCYLAVIEKDGDLDDSDTPIVIDKGEGKVFAFITIQKQKDMRLGAALRELYNRADGKCYVSIVLRRSGLLRRQTYRSASMQFSRKKSEKK